MPINVTTNVENSPDLSPSGGEGVIPEAVERAAEDASHGGFSLSQQLVPKDTSELMLSGVPPYRAPNGNIVWGYKAPHTLPVEFGSRPHWPPIEPLLKWARRVLGNEQAAYAVQKKIAAEGTEPQPFVRPGYQRMVDILQNTGLKAYIQAELPTTRS